MTDEIDKQTMARAYARWAPVYDLVFGAVFERGRRASIEAAERVCGTSGGRILDVGVGTGISLPDYSRSNRIVGVDYSEPMLRKARERVIEHKLDNVETVAVMDAKHLGFPDASFDVIVAQYVITAVPDPEATLDEFARAFEQWFSPVARRLGWRPEFPWARLTRWAERRSGIHLIERRPMPPLGHFSLIRFGKSAVPAQIISRASG
jgi:phosphatidylethanolamine/phosphatidyl-N-methylethanolamine N-methyltransferase